MLKMSSLASGTLRKEINISQQKTQGSWAVHKEIPKKSTQINGITLGKAGLRDKTALTL